MDAGINLANERAYPTPYAASPLLPLLLLSLAAQKHTPTTKSIFREEYDYVIVGAGAAGSVVASRLSELPCVSVLLLEAGKSSPLQTDIPAISRSFVNTDIDWKYLTTPQKHTGAGLNDRRIAWPSGKTVGGSTIWNAMMYVRGNRRNYDEWEKLGAKGWSYEDVLPYFIRLEDNRDPEFLKSGYHGIKGPVTVSRSTFQPLVKQASVEAILSEGYKFVDPNGPEQVGFYDYQANMRRGQRCSTAKAYLVPAENRKNLDILANARVRKVLIKNKRAVGVEFDFRGYTRRVRARREVILSAGTTNTPQLLMLSGIGPLNELKKHKIPLIADLPVGLNLKDHVATFLMYILDGRLPRFQDEIRNNNRIRQYINSKTGPLTCTEGNLLMSFLPNMGSTTKDIPDHTVYIWDPDNVLPLQVNLNPEILARVVSPLANKTTIVCSSQILHPKSRGTISLKSSNPYDPPKIDPNYLEDFRDVNDLVQGLKVCNKIMSNPAMKKLGVRPIDTLIPGCEEFAGDEDLYLRCIARTIAATVSHEVGTAKMGDPKDPTTVVDPQLRVKGITRLRVVDASIMPTIPWSNTNIPTIMVAEKASDIIKSTISCHKDYNKKLVYDQY